MVEIKTSEQYPFDRVADHYDQIVESNTILQSMRTRVHRHVLKFLKPGDRILEINAGTGIDAVFFAQQGYFVHATDVSEGMIKQLRRKVLQLGLEHRIKIEQRSFTDLELPGEAQFDYVFSNFGGLNCIPDIEPVTRQVHRLLKRGGYVTLVIMPKFCPWELLAALKGQFRLAFRRLQVGGTPAHIECVYFKCFYFSPTQVMKAFGNNLKMVQLEGLGSICPPPYRDDFTVKHPSIYRRLTRLEEQLAGYWPFNSWADHFILTVQFRPNEP